MKKLLSLVFALALVMSFAACGGSGDTTNDKSVIGVTGSSGTDDSSDDGAVDSIDPDSVTVEDRVVYDKDGIKITATGLGMNSLFGPELKLLIENSTSEDVIVQVGDSAVNGAMMTVLFSCDVAAGKKANESVTFFSDDFETAGISVIKEIELSFKILDPETFSTKAETELLKITTSVGDTYTQVFDTSGFAAYEDDAVRIIVKEMNSSESILGTELYVFIENSSDKSIMVQASDVSLNGFMVNPVFSSTVLPGKVAYDAVTFLESELEENSITEITSIEINFKIIDSESFSTMHETGKVTVTF